MLFMPYIIPFYQDNGLDMHQIMVLQAIQRQYNYLPGPALKYLSEKLRIPLSQIYGVGTFYASFSLEPRGRHVISVCLGTACHVRGSVNIAEEFEHLLGIEAGETTSDRMITLSSAQSLSPYSPGSASGFVPQYM